MAYRDKQVEIQEKLINEGERGVFQGAEGGGVYRGKKRCYILKNGEKNLYKPIREKVKEYFSKYEISWWGGQKPTGNTLSSQIACINHLFPIRDDKVAVCKIINGLEINGSKNNFSEVLSVPYDDKDEGFVAFEVVSKNDLLKESQHKRGSNCTSIDALIYALDKNGKDKWIILIEWKYTESYYWIDKSTEDRMGRYNELIEGSAYLSPLGINNCQGKVYYLEPFYQLMRQTLWAEQVIKHRKGGELPSEQIEVNKFLHLHVVPSGNPVIRGKRFYSLGPDMVSIWNKLNPQNYIKIDPQKLFEPIADKDKDLIDYLKKRYWQE